jgi:serine/threonine-protein phosphatase PGAM5
MRKSFLNINLTLPLIFSITLIFILLTAVDINAQENKEETKGICTIYLIRHGGYNFEDERDPDIGKELIPLGIAQARLVSSRLKSLPVKITSLISSTMTRARQTAMIINHEFPELELQKDSLIRECTPPTWRKDIMADETESNLEDCASNLEAAFTKYFVPSPDDEDRNDVIVCHGNVIRYFVTKVLNVNTLAWLQMTIGNCSLTIVRIMPNGMMRLIAFNDVGHIPPNMLTETGGDNKTKKLLLPVEK